MTIQEHLRALEAVISGKTGVSIDQIYSRRRDAQITHTRAIIWALAYEYLKYTFKQIGRAYERDHTTVINGYYRIKESVNIKKIAKEINKEVPGILERKKTDYEPIRRK